ncbi:MAG TPA: glycosyltransferase 87 family protein [Ktedonobacterales bacterium]|nr:glycosyltransferase 87 family protein [Ktedonobacterales bacterium]
MVEANPKAPRATPAPAGNAPVTIPRGAYAISSVAAVVFGWAAIVRGTSAVANVQQSDLTTFFFPAANQILNGHPWTIYAIRAFGGYPNYNPPISIFLMAPLLALAHALGIDPNNFRALIAFVSVPFVAFVLLLGYITVVALRRLFPGIPETQRFLAFILVVFGPLTWQTFTVWYHIEQPLMLALLVAAFLAFQARREGLAGVLAGLAVLSRTTAIVPLIAFGALLLLTREWRGLLKFGGIAGAVTAIGLAPFFLFDRADTMYSLVSWRGSAEIGGNSIWSLVRYDGAQQDSPLRYALDHVARRLDMYAVVAVVVIVTFLAVRRLRVSAYGREAWAVLAIATLAVPMLSKNNWPYYYLEPFVFLLIWEFASMHDRRSGVWRWPLLTIGFLGLAASLSQFIGLQSVGALDRIVVGLIEFGTMLVFAVAVWYRAGATRTERTADAVSTRAAPAGAAPPFAYDPRRISNGPPFEATAAYDPQRDARGSSPAGSPPAPASRGSGWSPAAEPRPRSGGPPVAGQSSSAWQAPPAGGPPVRPGQSAPPGAPGAPGGAPSSRSPRRWPPEQGQPPAAPPLGTWPPR